MELQQVSKNRIDSQFPFVEDVSTILKNEPINDLRFIESNTKPLGLKELQNEHLIPVFVKDNIPTISHAEFIQTTRDIIEETAHRSTSNLAIRVSHPIKGRVFEARHKKANELLESEKTIYYERMAFSFDLPTVKEEVNGEELTLSIVGVKAYNQDNLYGYGDSFQKFKVGIGYRVKVCTNLCLWSDGVNLDMRVRGLEQLKQKVYHLATHSDFTTQIDELRRFNDYLLTEQQFANLLGRIRMYNHLSPNQKKKIPPFLISDRQTSTVTKEYYKNEPFGKNPDGSISLWKLYNLFTDAVKSSYIDTFLDRNVNAFTFVKGIANALDGNSQYEWFLS